MTLDIRFRVRVKDLLALIEHEFGGLDGLAAHVERHPRDSARILLYEAALRNVDRPRRVLTFGRTYVGDPRRVVSAAKVEVLEYLMRHPGLSLRELARALERSPGTVSEQLEELRRAGLVLKQSHGAGRAVTLRALPHEIHIRLTSEEAAA